MSYTERERVFHVERMWAEGLTPRAAERRWGRPSRASLAAWEKAALAGELPAVVFSQVVLSRMCIGN